MKTEKAAALRLYGMGKTCGVLLAFFMLCRYGLHLSASIAGAIVLGVLLFSCAGEWLAVYQARGISEQCLSPAEQARLAQARRGLEEDTGMQLHWLRLYLLPDEGRILARPYGMGRIAVTRDVLSGDQGVLRALLCHALYHSICGDPFFKRVTFVTVGAAMAALTLCSLVTVASLWLIFLLLAVVGICGKGMLSLLVMHGVSKGVKGFFSLCQRAVLLLYQAANGMLSRSAEYRADRFVVDAGGGSGLLYFLSRFAEEGTGGQTLRELLYNSHPPKERRIARIRQYMEETHAVYPRS